MSSSPEAEERIREKIAELEQVYDRLIGCHVVVAYGQQRSRHTDRYEVHIELSVPGPPIVVGRSHHDRPEYRDLRLAINDAFKAARRQLQSHARKQRGEVKTHVLPTTGKIWHLVPEDRYGFIMSSEQVEIYFHENALVGVDYDDLEVGDEVRYVVHPKEGIKGPQASTVSPISGLPI